MGFIVSVALVTGAVTCGAGAAAGVGLDTGADEVDDVR